jgi:hypothetical protein
VKSNVAALSRGLSVRTKVDAPASCRWPSVRAIE